MGCECSERYKVLRRSTQCLEDTAYEVVDFKCVLCGKLIYGELQRKELDWEGLG